MKINQKRNIFVFVTLLVGLIWFIYFNITMIQVLLNDPAPEFTQAYMYLLPHNIAMGIGVVFSYLAYKNYTPKKILLAFIFYIISVFLGLGLGLMILPAAITAALAMFLKVNQDSTKFVGK